MSNKDPLYFDELRQFINLLLKIIPFCHYTNNIQCIHNNKSKYHTKVNRKFNILNERGSLRLTSVVQLDSGALNFNSDIDI